MARVASRLYVPLDANFFDDDKIMQAGEAGGWLYLKMCTRAKLLDTDGILTERQVAALGVPAWKRRMEALMTTEPEPLVVRQDDRYGIVGWLKWNESAADREARLAADRARKAGGKK